jgi:cell division protein FtsL
MRKGAGHVGIPPECDALPRGTASGPQPGSETSWRNAPQRRVSTQVLAWLAVAAVLLVCFGLLLGVAWTTQAIQPKLRQWAEERKQLDEEWSRLRTLRHQRGSCPRCARHLSERDWYFFPPTVVADQSEDDD